MLENYYHFNIHAIPLFIIATFVIVLGFFVLFKNVKIATNKYFFSICICVFIWLIATGMGYLSNFEKIATLWFKIDNFAVMFVSSLFFGLAVSATGNNKKLSKFIILGILISAVFGFLGLLNSYFISNSKLFFWGYFPQWKVINSVPYFVFWFGYSTASFILLNKEKKLTNSASKKVQLNFLMIGFFIIYLASVDYISTFNVLLFGKNIYPIGFLPTFIFLCVISYAVVSLDFLDIGFAAKKLLSWFITFLMIFCFESGLYLLIKGQNIPQFFIFLILLFNGIAIYFITNFILALLRPAIFKDFENRLKNLEEMTTQDFTFNDIQDFGLHLTKNISEIMNSKETSFVIFNSETGNFDLVSQFQSQSFQNCSTFISFPMLPTDPIIEHLNQIKDPIIKSTFGRNEKYNTLKIRLNDLQIEAIFPFYVNGKLMAFLILCDSANNYLYHKKELQKLKYLIKLKEHLFENTYFLNMQKKIVDMTQTIIDIDDSEIFNHYLTSTLTRQFNILNSAFYVFDKDRKSFICVYQIGYAENEIIKEISEENALIKLLTESKNILTLADFQIQQNTNLKFKSLNESLDFMTKLKSTVVVPLISTKNIIGVFFFGDKRIENEYYNHDLNFIKNISTIASIKLLGFMIKTESETDTLTKAYSRKALDIWMPKLISRAKKEKKSMVVLSFDIDSFKNINDSKSHTAGDYVLIELVQCFKKGSRSEDIIIRMGGDEFVCILWDIKHDTEVENIVDRVKVEIKKGKYTENITLSIGRVTFVPNRDIEDKINNIKNIQKTILRNSDDSSYYSKKNGKNQLQAGGIVEDSKIDEKYKWTLQIITDTKKYDTEFGKYFISNNIDVQESKIENAMEVFEKIRPDAFLIIMDEDTDLETIVRSIKELKKRSVSSSLSVVLKNYLLKEQLTDLSIDCFFNMDEPKQIEYWAKSITKDLE
jgi:diguanylate cyclase (GGDEF)-like protein